MKTPREYVASFDARKTLTVAEAELLVANVLLDAGDYKDRVINALFRLKSGESEIAAASADNSTLLPVGAKIRKPVGPAPDAGEETHAAARVATVGGSTPTRKGAPAPEVAPVVERFLDFDAPEVKATKRVPEVVLKAERGGKNKVEALSSPDENPSASDTSKGSRKSKSTAPADEPAAPPLGKAGLPPTGLGRTGPAAPGKFSGKPAPRRPIKR